MENQLKFEKYLTIYNKDYIKRKVEKTHHLIAVQEFHDPITEGFKEYLVLDGENIPEPKEDQEQFLNKLKKKKQKIGEMYFKTPIDKNILTKYDICNNGTVYQRDYCDIIGDIEKKEEAKRTRIVLPEDWNIPLTTQRYAYREPLSLSEHAMDRPAPIKASTNLKQNEQINKILNVKTGNSEYMEVIGKLGDFIVNEQMHGKITHP